jgi:hypothetical protein
LKELAMRLDFEYGGGFMAAELSDSADVFIPGETIGDPDHIREDRLKELTLHSLRNPIGMPPLRASSLKGGIPMGLRRL